MKVKRRVDTGQSNALPCSEREDSLLDEVTGKVGWGGKHEFHGEVGFGPGFQNHKMVHPGSMSLRDGRECDANNGSHLTSQLSVLGTLCALTHYVPQQSLS